MRLTLSGTTRAGATIPVRFDGRPIEALAGETESPFEKRYYLTLSYEERGHYLRLVDAIQFLKDPAGWYYVSERDMVDGG